MREEWRPVVGYEGLYEVSNMGRVKSLERTVWNNSRGCYVTVHEKILKPNKVRHDYLQVMLYQDSKRKPCYIHRIVAIAFLPNPENYTEVNHKDEDKTNNCVDNLEWCSRSYNNTYNDRAKKVGEKKSKAIIGIDKVSGLIVEFLSAKEAGGVLGIDSSHICGCCKGKLKSAGGFYWMYANVNDAE